MAMENKRIIQLSTERTTLGDDDYTIVDSGTNGTAKYRLSRLKETDTTLSVSGMAADAAATGQTISDEAEARSDADTALGNDIDDLKSALDKIDNIAWEGEYPLLSSDLEQGAISGTGNNASSTTRIRTKGFLPVKAGAVIVFKKGVNVTAYTYNLYNTAKVNQSQNAWLTGNTTIPIDGYVRFVFRKGDGTDTATVSDYDADIEISSLIKQKSDKAYNASYKYTGNMLDFGFIGGTWSQGYPNGSEPYVCHTIGIPVQVGDVYYGVIDKLKYDESFSYPMIQLIVRAYNSNNQQVGDGYILSTNGSQQTGAFTIASGVAYVILILTTTAWGNALSPTMLDNAVESFAYFGKENISHQNIFANYIPYPEKNDEQITALSEEIAAKDEEIDFVNSVKIPSLFSYNIDLLNKLSANKSGNLYGYQSSNYIAKSTSESWVNESHAIIRDIPVTPGTVICYGCIASNCAGVGAGALIFYNASGDSIKTVYIYPTQKNKDGGFVSTALVPNNATTATLTLYGISSGENTIVGEAYYIYGGFVYIGNLDFRVKTIPTAWEDAIQIMQTEQGASLAFGVQTDTHYYQGMSLDLAFNLNEMSNILGLDFIVNLGDLIQGYDITEADSNANTRKSMTDIVRRYTENAGCPVIIVPGNHDSNSMNARASGEAEFTNAEIFARMIKPCVSKNSKAVCENGKLYYYMDAPSARIIVVNSQDGGEHISDFGISDTQKNWFINTALNTQKPVVVLSHTPLVANFNNNYHQSYTKITDALISFKQNGGIVIGCFCGHTHNNNYYEVDGIYHIAFTETFSHPDVTGSFVFVNTDTEIITIYGFGDATNREIQYS